MKYAVSSSPLVIFKNYRRKLFAPVDEALHWIILAIFKVGERGINKDYVTYSFQIFDSEYSAIYSVLWFAAHLGMKHRYDGDYHSNGLTLGATWDVSCILWKHVRVYQKHLHRRYNSCYPFSNLLRASIIFFFKLTEIGKKVRFLHRILGRRIEVRIVQGTNKLRSITNTVYRLYQRE